MTVSGLNRTFKGLYSLIIIYLRNEGGGEAKRLSRPIRMKYGIEGESGMDQ